MSTTIASHPVGRAPDTRTSSTRGVLAGLSLSALLAALGVSSVNAGLPAISRALGASFQEVQWVVLAYLLALTATVVAAGRLGDLADRRRLLLAGLATIAASSLLAASAHALWLLVAARALQGLGAALVMSLSIALVAGSAPRGRIGSAMGWLGAMSAAGTALGPSLGGLLIGWMGWRSVFLLNVPVALAAAVLIGRQRGGEREADAGVPAPLGGSSERFDLWGTVLLAATLVSYALAFTLGRGRFGSLNVVLLGFTAVGLAWFVRVEARSPAPIVPMQMLRDRAVRSALAASALVSTVLMATLVVGPFYLAHALGLGTASAGLVLSVGPLVAASSGVPAGRLVDRLGPGRSTVAGLVAAALGAAALASSPTALGVVGYAAPLAITTAGYALFQASNNTAFMAAVPSSRRGVASGLLTLSRNLGLTTGASVMGAVFAAASGAPDASRLTPVAATAGMRTTFAVAAALLLLALAIVGRAARTGGAAGVERERNAGRRRLLRPSLQLRGCDRPL